MFSHKQIWAAIDRLADHHSLSPSGLSRRAGLDPTAFNKSKRFAKDGRPRWPSTESIAKILDVTQTSFEDFYRFVSKDGSEVKSPQAAQGHVPLLGFSQAGVGGFFDDGGYPAGEGWQEVSLPVMGDEGAYALRVSGDIMLPLYRDGDIIIVSTMQKPVPGDRVVVKTRSGDVMAKVLLSETSNEISLMAFDMKQQPLQLPTDDVVWLARITWASQ